MNFHANARQQRVEGLEHGRGRVCAGAASLIDPSIEERHGPRADDQAFAARDDVVGVAGLLRRLEGAVGLVRLCVVCVSTSVERECSRSSWLGD